MKQTFYNSIPVQTFKQVDFTVEEFEDRLKMDKPSEIWHSYYSSKEPCYYITDYYDNGVRVYAKAWADKTPQYRLYSQLYREFMIQGFTMFYYLLNKEQGVQVSDTTTAK